jgi:hypothetical protein
MRIFLDLKRDSERELRLIGLGSCNYQPIKECIMEKEVFKRKLQEKIAIAERLADRGNVIDLRVYINDCLDGVYETSEIDELYSRLVNFNDWFIDIYENLKGENRAEFIDITLFSHEMEKISTPLVVRSDDLVKIGHTRFERDGKLHILIHPTTAGIESILLRNILAIKGYSIVAEQDFIWEDGTTDIEFVTDMPW